MTEVNGDDAPLSICYLKKRIEEKRIEDIKVPITWREC